MTPIQTLAVLTVFSNFAFFFAVLLAYYLLPNFSTGNQFADIAVLAGVGAVATTAVGILVNYARHKSGSF